MAIQRDIEEMDEPKKVEPKSVPKLASEEEPHSVECPECGGTGLIGDGLCSDCDGSGEVTA